MTDEVTLQKTDRDGELWRGRHSSYERQGNQIVI